MACTLNRYIPEAIHFLTVTAQATCLYSYLPFVAYSVKDMNNRPVAPKIAIPRFDHNNKPPQIKHREPRARQACDECRKRRVKCSGERPICRNCVDLHVPCIYSRARRDLLKEATDQNSQLIALLKDLSLRIDPGEKGKIEGLLDSVWLLNCADH